MNPYSSFLFARPSFIEGVARALDLGGTLQEYNASLSSQRADATALQMDWRVIEEDALSAMNEISPEQEIVIGEELISRARAVLGLAESLELHSANGR